MFPYGAGAQGLVSAWGLHAAQPVPASATPAVPAADHGAVQDAAAVQHAPASEFAGGEIAGIGGAVFNGLVGPAILNNSRKTAAAAKTAAESIKKYEAAFLAFNSGDMTVANAQGFAAYVSACEKSNVDALQFSLLATRDGGLQLVQFATNGTRQALAGAAWVAHTAQTAAAVEGSLGGASGLSVLSGAMHVAEGAHTIDVARRRAAAITKAREHADRKYRQLHDGAIASRKASAEDIAMARFYKTRSLMLASEALQADVVCETAKVRTQSGAANVGLGAATIGFAASGVGLPIALGTSAALSLVSANWCVHLAINKYLIFKTNRAERREEREAIAYLKTLGDEPLTQLGKMRMRDMEKKTVEVARRNHGWGPKYLPHKQQVGPGNNKYLQLAKNAATLASRLNGVSSMQDDPLVHQMMKALVEMGVSPRVVVAQMIIAASKKTTEERAVELYGFLKTALMSHHLNPDGTPKMTIDADRPERLDELIDVAVNGPGRKLSELEQTFQTVAGRYGKELHARRKQFSKLHQDALTAQEPGRTELLAQLAELTSQAELATPTALAESFETEAKSYLSRVDADAEQFLALNRRFDAAKAGRGARAMRKHLGELQAMCNRSTRLLITRDGLEKSFKSLMEERATALAQERRALGTLTQAFHGARAKNDLKGMREILVELRDLNRNYRDEEAHDLDRQLEEYMSSSDAALDDYATLCAQFEKAKKEKDLAAMNAWLHELHQMCGLPDPEPVVVGRVIASYESREARLPNDEKKVLAVSRPRSLSTQQDIAQFFPGTIVVKRG